jgi:hypothetical protein
MYLPAFVCYGCWVWWKTARWRISRPDFEPDIPCITGSMKQSILRNMLNGTWRFIAVFVKPATKPCPAPDQSTRYRRRFPVGFLNFWFFDQNFFTQFWVSWVMHLFHPPFDRPSNVPWEHKLCSWFLAFVLYIALSRVQLLLPARAFMAAWQGDIFTSM